MKAIREFKQYFNYAIYAAFSELKTQVAESYLGWVWWILDPLLFMLVYSFMTVYIFKNNIENIWLFVFIGITVWNFFSTTISSSIGCIRSYSSVIIKAYIPKTILVFMISIVNFIKMMISLAICIICSFLVGMDQPVYMLNLIPLLITLCILTFGVSLICAFVGVYITDFNNVMNVVLRFLFYFSGVFYRTNIFPEKILKIYNLACPSGFIISEFRNALTLCQPINYPILLYWTVVGIVLTVLGTYLLYKKENEYMKVI